MFFVFFFNFLDGSLSTNMAYSITLWLNTSPVYNDTFEKGMMKSVIFALNMVNVFPYYFGSD